MSERVIDIRCTSCGAPAKYDIYHQIYKCQYCGKEIGLDSALKQRYGFRELQNKRIKESFNQFPLCQSECKGCGAKIIFNEDEAVGTCDFCGSSLVRSKYLKFDNAPEYIIPFGVTLSEAKGLLAKWCAENKKLKEAKHLEKLIDKLQGYYLPYEMVNGPVNMDMGRKSSYGLHKAYGYLDDEFVNGSKQLDNLLLDGCEPFDVNEMVEFDLSYVAGQKVKVLDINEKQLNYRIMEEVKKSFGDFAHKVFNSKLVDIFVDSKEVMTLPVLLPVYFIADDGFMVAVNGQSGKVSVRSEKSYSSIIWPWWVKSLFAIGLLGIISFVSFILLGATKQESVGYTGMLLIFFGIVITCLFNQELPENSFKVNTGYRIYTSLNNGYTRENGRLVLRSEPLVREVSDPVFMVNVKNQPRAARFVFGTTYRTISTLLLCILVIFLPVIIALFINGFDFERLYLPGSAIWFCIAVPVVPIYYLQFGILHLYENPWIYLLDEGDGKKRYREKKSFSLKDVWEAVKIIIGLLVVPPICFASWFALAAIYFTIVFTAFGI